MLRLIIAISFLFSAAFSQKAFKCFSYDVNSESFLKEKLYLNSSLVEGVLKRRNDFKIIISAGSAGKHADPLIPIMPPSHIMSGNAKYNPQSSERLFPATQGQDELILKLLNYKTGGYYIDVGARYWNKGSNTFALDYYYGWSGVCIEPDSHFYRGLSINRTCTVICNNPIDEKIGNVKQYSYSLGQPLKRNGNDFGYKTTITLQGVFDYMENRAIFLRRNGINKPLPNALPPVIDYLSLDIEGHEWIALKGVDLSKHVFLIMSIERPRKYLHEHLVSNGYWWLTQIRNVKYSPAQKHFRGNNDADQTWKHQDAPFFGECIYVHESIPRFKQLMGEYRPKANSSWSAWTPSGSKYIDYDFLIKPSWPPPPDYVPYLQRDS